MRAWRIGGGPITLNSCACSGAALMGTLRRVTASNGAGLMFNFSRRAIPSLPAGNLELVLQILCAVASAGRGDRTGGSRTAHQVRRDAAEIGKVGKPPASFARICVFGTQESRASERPL